MGALKVVCLVIRLKQLLQTVWKDETIRSRAAPLLKLMLGASLLTFLVYSLDLHFFEAKLYDFRVSQVFTPAPDSRIVIVSLDDTTVQAFNEISPLTLDVHTQFVEEMEKAGVRALGLLIDFNSVSQIHPALFMESWGRRFVESVRRMEGAGSPVVIGTSLDVSGEVIPPYPLSMLSHAVSIIHKDGNVFSEDQVTRRALVTLFERPSFHWKLAQRIFGIETGDSVLGEADRVPRGTFAVKAVDSSYLFFRYHRGAHHAYPVYSLVDILDKRVPLEEFQGKVVLYGALGQENLADFTLTPFSKSYGKTANLLVHANIIDTLLKDDGVLLFPFWLNVVVTWVLICLVMFWAVGRPPLWGTVATFSLSFVFFALCALIFRGLFGWPGVWIQESQTLVGMLAGYYLVIPYRLIQEHRKRWEFEKKHEIFLKVEELKTNFLSLVTHDLKTPVARIHGFAELLRRRNKSEGRAGQELDAIDGIARAAEELNQFISRLLELNRLESDRLQIQKVSRDVNSLVEKAVENLSTSANAKGIQIELDLEPLFPISIDPGLILKVLHNLIDNAIKYSPEQSKITIRSREENGFVEVQVYDQGLGISAEEVPNLFSRFYRVPNEATRKVSGSGLGLYLTKYFVEGHQGQVHCESQTGQGSVFTIRLPVQPCVDKKGENYV